MKYIDTPLVLIILFLVFLYALVFSIQSVVIPLKQEVAALKETEVMICEILILLSCDPDGRQDFIFQDKRKSKILKTSETVEANCKCGKETEIIKGNKIYEIVAKY